MPDWLGWGRRLQAIAQTGLTYAGSAYDTERYEEIREIAAELMAAHFNASAAEVLDLMSRDTGYATPKVDVRAAVFQADRILLVREREDGCWTLPGGWADVGDSPAKAVVREVKEESGYDVRVTKLAALFDRDLHGHPPIPWHAYKGFFLCEVTGGEPANSTETDGVGFFAVNELPPLSLTRINEEEIRHLFDHSRHPEWPASFD